MGYMGEINASAKNDIVRDFRNRNDEMLAKSVKVRGLNDYSLVKLISSVSSVKQGFRY